MDLIKLSRDDQDRVRAYLENINTIYGLGLLVSVCSYCGNVYGVKLGGRIAGFSHGICSDCKGIDHAENTENK